MDSLSIVINSPLSKENDMLLRSQAQAYNKDLDTI